MILSRKILFIFLLFGLVFSDCKEPYEDSDLEKEWGKEIYEKHRDSVKCIFEKESNLLTKLSADILSKTRDNPFKFQFCITDSKEINAYAIPAGYIFIHSGILNSVSSEGELVFLLGHEISHVLLRHSYRTVKKQLAGKALSEKTRGLSKIGPVQLFGVLGLLKFSRDFEKSSDLKALEFVTSLGYDPASSLNLMITFEKLKFRKSNLIETLLSTHPDPTNRKKYLQRSINRIMGKEKFKGDSKEFIELKTMIEKKMKLQK